MGDGIHCGTAFYTKPRPRTINPQPEDPQPPFGVMTGEVVACPVGLWVSSGSGVQCLRLKEWLGGV